MLYAFEFAFSIRVSGRGRLLDGNYRGSGRAEPQQDRSWTGILRNPGSHTSDGQPRLWRCLYYSVYAARMLESWASFGIT